MTDVSRAAQHALWRAGDLSFLLHRGQEEVIENFRTNGQRRTVWNLSRRFGKSWGALVDAAEFGSKGEAYRQWASPETVKQDIALDLRYAAPEKSQVREIIFPHLRDIFATAPPEMQAKPNANTGKWHFPNGSTLHIAGANKKGADRLRGTGCHRCYVDEARDIDDLWYLVKDVLTPQLLTTDGKMLIFSTPPEVPDHAFVDLIQQAEVKGAYSHKTIYDAPHITPEKIEEFLADYNGEDDPAWIREYLARIIVDPTRVAFPEMAAVSDDDDPESIIRAVPQPGYFFPHVIGDLGFSHWTVILFGYYHWELGIDVIEREYVTRQSTSETISSNVDRIERELWGNRRVKARRADGQPQTLADLSNHEMQHPSIDDGQFWISVRNTDPEAACNGARVRIGRRRVAIHPDCKILISHLRYARKKRGRTFTFEEHVEDGHHYDAASAFMYFCRDLDRHTNPLPLIPKGVTEGTHFIHPGLRRRIRDQKLGLFRTPRRRRR